VFAISRSELPNAAFVTIERLIESSADIAVGQGEDGTPHIVTGVRSVKQVFGIQFAWSDGSIIELNGNWEDAVDGSRAAPGIISVKKADLVEVEGYNSELQSWGGEDNDIQLRLRRVLKLTHVQRGEAMHISHGDEQRCLYGMSRDQSGAINLATMCRRYCAGDFRGTYAKDTWEWGNKVLISTVGTDHQG
jgi:hypothetical protein